ncbi:MAG TPA: hypothetical protein PLX15_04895 [Candidatus Woesearchaeota archaeon]|nr:hypothetical protein [Candidatus Woesearchaeota archaeon]
MMNSKIEGKNVTFEVDSTIYPYEIIVETANNFLESCFIFLDKKEDNLNKISVSLEPKGEENPKEVLGSFFNMMNGLLYRYVSEKEEKEEEKLQAPKKEYDPQVDYDPNCDCEDCQNERKRRELSGCM